MAVEEPSPDPIAETSRRRANAGSSKRRARPWHRVLGLITALPLVWVVITGAVLNHTVDWKLDEIEIDNSLVLTAYGMVPDGEPKEIVLEGDRVAFWDGVIFFNGVHIPAMGELIGALPDGDGVAMVTDSQVLRVDAKGALVESLGGLGLPELPLEKVAVDGGDAWIRSGGVWHLVSSDWLNFEVRNDVEFDGQVLSVIHDKELRSELEKSWSGGGLPASRVLLDLHAAKFLGPVSKYFYDIVAVCTIWLSVTGLILFFRKPRKAR